MTQNTDSNAESLFKAARKGDKYAFFKLVPNFYKEIYHLVYKIIPSPDRAEETLKEIFVLAADNVAHIKEGKDLFEWLRKISAIVSLYNLREHPLYNGGDQELPPLSPQFSEVEAVYASFTDLERVVLTLYLQFDYTPEIIAGFITDQTEEGVVQILNDKLERLCYFTPFKECIVDHKSDFIKLVSSYNIPGESPEQVIENKKPEFLDKFADFIDLVRDLFASTPVRTGILDEIQDELINENKIKERHSRKKEIRNQELQSLARSTASQTSSGIGGRAIGKAKSLGYKASFIDVQKLLVTLLILVLTAAGVYGYLEYSKYNTPWSVRALEGDVSINGTTETDLNENEVASTEEASTAKIVIPSQATIKLYPKSTLKLIKGHREQNIFDVNGTGFELMTNLDTAKFVEFADQPPYSIRFGDVRITTELAQLQCSRILNQIKLNFGWAEVVIGSHRISLASNHSVSIAEGNLLNIPVYAFTDSAQKSRINIMNVKGLDPETLASFIVNSTELDALSLFYLLTKTTIANREMIVSKLESFFPAITDEVRQGLIKEKPESLEYVRGFLKWILLFQ
ncbi:MAG: hypothetical protein LCH52_15120 [Bacteroidetes bacterium]|nr:hypothetical protein [Bacteroidota bacterium]